MDVPTHPQNDSVFINNILKRKKAGFQMADYSVTGEEKWVVAPYQTLGLGPNQKPETYEAGDIISRSSFPDPSTFDRFVELKAIKLRVGLEVQQELQAELDRVKAELEASRAAGPAAASVGVKSAKDK